MNKLKSNCLNFTELLAQNIALISPTMTAALIVPLMFATIGNISWLGYALGTTLLLFVVLNLNQFAKRTTNSGSMYSYASSGLGFTGGAMCGWCLVWSYLFIGLAGTTGFTIFSGKLLDAIHIHLPPPVLFAICLGTCFMMAYKDIRISTLVMLGMEAFSCFFILLLVVIVLGHHHFALDTAQFSFKGMSLMSLGMGTVVAIFSLVGFESSTAFGEEAVNPLKTIPRSIIWSLILTGLFFILTSYTEVLGTRGYTTTLDQIDAPLNVLAQMNHVNYLWPLLSAGAMFSFFALASSCMNAGARVMYAMGRHDFFHKSTSAAHETHGTPHIALSVMAIIMFSVVTVCYFVLTHFGMAVLDEFNDAGTMGAMGFTGAYILITLAAPGFLKKRGELKAKHIALSAVTLVLMLIPAIGLVYPVPAAPVNYFPYVFLAYLWFGLLRVMAMQHQKPERLVEIRDEVKKMHTATA
ncbi:MAG TPA: APC family permease [Verrucomicrobiae bacterium]|jgi:amino acid transporter|nr:APC family permease [Verrucomicrobiae bacterium]